MLVKGVENSNVFYPFFCFFFKKFKGSQILLQQHKIQISKHSSSYDLIVPKHNLLRKINELVDFSFVYEELVNKYCMNNGRMAESPVRMFKYLLLKTIYTISDVDLVERSRYDSALSNGISNTQMQGALAIFAVNLKRIIKLTE